MNLNAFDSHAHLDLEQFDPDREEVISRALASGVSRINTIGIDLEASRKSIALAERYPGVLASVGIHPQEAYRAKTEDFPALEELARHPRVVAIGETGLDFHSEGSTRQSQVEVFRHQLDLAAKLKLPVIIHSRQAQNQIRPLLEEWSRDHPLPQGKARGIIHCYSGDLETALFYLNLGFYIAVGAYIGYPSSKQFRETLRGIPSDKLLAETDCPFLPPQSQRGKRNEPSYLPITLGVIAEVKGQSLSEIAQQTTANTIQVFDLEERNLV